MKAAASQSHNWVWFKAVHSSAAYSDGEIGHKINLPSHSSQFLEIRGDKDGWIYPLVGRPAIAITTGLTPDAVTACLLLSLSEFKRSSRVHKHHCLFMCRIHSVFKVSSNKCTDLQTSSVTLKCICSHKLRLPGSTQHSQGCKSYKKVFLLGAVQEDKSINLLLQFGVEFFLPSK